MSKFGKFVVYEPNLQMFLPLSGDWIEDLEDAFICVNEEEARGIEFSNNRRYIGIGIDNSIITYEEALVMDIMKK